MNKPAVIPALAPKVKPFDTIHIHEDGTYTRADILNDGAIHLVVDFPEGTDVCEIDLGVTFTSSRHPKNRTLLATKQEMRTNVGGGTIVIGG